MASLTTFRLFAVATLILSTFMCAPASAKDTWPFDWLEWDRNADLWEARIGAGAFNTRALSDKTGTPEGVVVHGEIVAPSPDSLRFIGSPRPYLGVEGAFSHEPIHVFYGGLTWQAYFTERFYYGFSLGGAVVSDTQVIGDRSLGSNVLFNLQWNAGFDITPKQGVQFFVNHFSNANLADKNDGLDTTGGRFIYRF